MPTNSTRGGDNNVNRQEKPSSVDVDWPGLCTETCAAGDHRRFRTFAGTAHLCQEHGMIYKDSVDAGLVAVKETNFLAEHVERDGRIPRIRILIISAHAHFMLKVLLAMLLEGRGPSCINRSHWRRVSSRSHELTCATSVHVMHTNFTFDRYEVVKIACGAA
jgi:hypothetical protein